MRDHVATSKAKGLPSPVREGIPGPFGLNGLRRSDLISLGRSLLDSSGCHLAAGLGHLLAVLVGMEVHDPSAADADDVSTGVEVRLTGSRRCMSEPLHGNEQVPRRARHDHLANLEAQLEETKQPLEPAANAVTAMALAA